MSSLRTDMIDNVWISTAPRTTYIAEIGGKVKYYETIVWEYDHIEKNLGKILYMGNGGNSKYFARKAHERIVKIFRYLAWRKRRSKC
jgi:hypothetical protein